MITADTVSINYIAESLRRRGFLAENSQYDADLVQEQVNAVIEELGEVCRDLRRIHQGREPLDTYRLALEGADLVIASVCLLTRISDRMAPEIIREKLEADEQRGWLHSGLTRAEYEYKKQQ